MKDRLQSLSAKKSGDIKINVADQVKRSLLKRGLEFPLMIKPIRSGLSLNHWIAANKKQFENDLLKYGAVLFRGFRIDTVEKFQHLMDIFPQELLEYKLRSSPRHELVNNIYVSTTYPADQRINMHSESSYAPIHPERIVFCCITPAQERGETPIADNRLILTHLNEATKRKFFDKGVQYRRNLSGVLGLSWQEVFQSSDTKFVEEECAKNEMNYSWTNDNTLILKWNKKAIWKHPVTDEWVWFNHGLFFNKYMLDEEILAAVNSDDDLPNNTFLGDGSEISKEEVEEIREAYQKSTVEFPWEKGDVLFLDNMLMSHGRNPYVGERKIVVSLS